MVENSFRKSMRRLIRWALNSDDDSPTEVSSGVNKVRMYGDNDLGEGMNLTVYGAVGGKVIKFHSYDPIRDKHLRTLYIVTDREDLGEELGQIITKESLSR